MRDTELRELAQRYGIQPSYRDNSGVVREAPVDTLRAIIDARAEAFERTAREQNAAPDLLRQQLAQPKPGEAPVDEGDEPGVDAFFKQGPFEQVDDGAGAESTDELVEAEIEDEQENGNARPGVHRPVGEALGEGSPLPPPAGDDTFQKPLADPLALKADAQMQIGAALEDDPGHALWKRDFTGASGLIFLGSPPNRFIASRFRYPERQYEEPYFADWFQDRGFEVSLMPRDMPFEGAGDALFDRSGPSLAGAGSDSAACLWMAHGHRSIHGARDVLAERLGIDVVVLKLVDQRFYHLDTCFCPLEGGYVLYYPPAFDAESRAVIEKRIPAAKRIVVAEEDALAFACNAVNIDDIIVLNRASADLVRSVARKGFDVQQTPLSEFMKAGGSAKCLTLRLDEP